MVGKRITEPGFSDRPTHGRGFRLAMTVVGMLLFVQILAIARGVLRRDQVAATRGIPILSLPPANRVAPVAPAGRSVSAAPVAALPPKPVPPSPDVSDAVVQDPVAPAPLISKAAGEGPVFLGPADGPETATSTGSNDPAALFAALASAARSQVLGDGILERLLVTGTELRASGNTQGALQALREVESAMPEHPRVLSELAATLGLMGLTEKSRGYWGRVEALGAAGAGGYYPIAAGQLHGEAPAEAPGAAPAAEDPLKPLKIGEIKVEEQAPTGNGQKVSLQVVIDADPSIKPAGEDLKLLVYFYDRAADGSVRPSTADTSYLYPTEPYDWQVNSTETVVVNYNQPVFTEEQKRELGERSYYGYAIELYYRDQLMDKVAMPEDIALLRFQTAPVPGDPGEASTGGANPAAPVRPENALFPAPVIP